MMLNHETDLTWKYHDFTKHSYWSVRRSAHYLDWDNKPSPFKIYPDIEPLHLPRELMRTASAALDAAPWIEPVTASARVPSLDQLASLLYHSAGVTKKKTFPGGEIYFRASACAGALYPVETYIVCAEIEGLAAGVYHFNPGDFALRCLRSGDHRAALASATAGEPHIKTAPVVLVHTAISWRSTWKYRDRAYRYHFWDDGMVAANALALAGAHSLPSWLVLGFVDAEVNKLLGIDGERELPLSLLALGHDPGQAPPTETGESLPLLTAESLPLSDSQIDYESIQEMHRASSLNSEGEVAAWRGAIFTPKEPEAVGPVIPLRPTAAEALPTDTIEEVIQRRASTRRFALKPLPFADLSVILDRATRGIQADFLADGEQLNDIYLIVNRVDGLAPGAYYYHRRGRALELLKEGDFSQQASYLTLDQDLGGDASATLFFMSDLSPVLEKLGNRGYRSIQMEAGLIGGRAYLAAYGLGRGATGLTFYDDDVTSFFMPHAANKSCIFVTSLGIPGKKPIY